MQEVKRNPKAITLFCILPAYLLVNFSRTARGAALVSLEKQDSNPNMIGNTKMSNSNVRICAVPAV